MKNFKLKHLIFMALCCDFGLFAKKLILPAANLVTDALHIPGGIGTSFSLMFLIVAAFLLPNCGCAAVMGTVQSVIAFSFGMVGSMGALAPVGYIVPGIVIDLVRQGSKRLHLTTGEAVVIASVLSSISASLTANLIVFHLRGLVLLLYASVAGTSGAICGILANSLVVRLEPVIGEEQCHEKKEKSHTWNHHSVSAYHGDSGSPAYDHPDTGTGRHTSGQL